mmetsp:Transcript_10913/g.19721  ORF Transcript_10913/g.19721 Transcript_10913/m.19721 type:complete len:194 (-) Transcript_10913:74-655(-)
MSICHISILFSSVRVMIERNPASSDEAHPKVSSTAKSKQDPLRSTECKEFLDQARISNCSPLIKRFPELGEYFGSDFPSHHFCTACEYSTFNRTTLLYHVVAKHLELSPFQCRFCGIKTSSYTNMSQHQKRVHQHSATKEDSDYMCGGCGCVFGAPLNLLFHYFLSHRENRPGSQQNYEETRQKMSISRLIHQ